MKQYAIERIKALIAELNEFNSHPLTEIILTENGFPIFVPGEVIEEFRFIGLSNKCFVELDYWKPEDESPKTNESEE